MKKDDFATSPDDSKRSSSGRIRLQRDGGSPIDNIVASAREVPWSLTVLQMLWTAGPVTFLAMHGGHYIGFGSAAPTANLIFFAAYTLILGLIGLLARFAAKLTRGRKQQEARRNMVRVMDLLPELMFTTRDLGLAELPAEVRRREAAGILLRKADLGPESVALAVEELTDDPVLARAAERIEIYRRLGLSSRVRDLVVETADRRTSALETLHAIAPDSVDVLRDRLTGVAPTQESGVARGDGFIERTLAVAENDDSSLMSLTDAEDMIVLTLELMSGREIVQLRFDYEGDWRLARALDDVERARHAYRLAQAVAVGHLHGLTTCLIGSEHSGLDEEALRLPAAELLDQCFAAVDTLTLAVQRSRRLDPRAATTLRHAVRFMKRLRRASSQIRNEQSRYQRALKRWEQLHRERLQDSGKTSGRTRRLRIRERTIHLTDEQKLEVARSLCQYLNELNIRSTDQSMLRGTMPFEAQDAKRLAITLAMVLDPIIRFSDASIQMAISGSNAAYFHGMETGFSADAKTAIAAAVVKEVQQDLGRTAERLALRLSRVYHVQLSESMVDFLVESYGASRERLEVIASTPIPDDPAPLQVPGSLFTMAVVARWKATIAKAERVLDSRTGRRVASLPG